jgi:integrase
MAGSLLLAAFSTWAGAFVRRRRGDTLVYRSVASPVLTPYSGPPLLLPPPESRPEPPVLGSPHPNARELRGDEIAALMAKGSDEVRLVMAALLTGMTPAEIISLRWDTADPKAASVTMDGDPDRRVRIEDSLLARLRVRWLANGARGAAVIRDENDNPASEADIDRLLVFTAHDAGIMRPQDITAEVLSHTYAAFRMRQARRAA